MNFFYSSSIRNFQVIDKNLEGHLHSHMHFGNTLIGIVGGMFFYKLWQRNFNLRKYKVLSARFIYFIQKNVIKCLSLGIQHPVAFNYSNSLRTHLFRENILLQRF